MIKEREMLEKVSKLRKLRDIQGKKGNHDYDEYMRGLYNGLELALSLFEDEREPQYKNPLAQPEPPMTGREMYQRGYAAAERDLKVLVVVLKQQLAEKVAHIELEPQRQKDITAKQRIESFRSGYFRAILDLKPVNGADND
jgi:hypothetical protein